MGATAFVFVQTARDGAEWSRADETRPEEARPEETRTPGEPSALNY